MSGQAVQTETKPKKRRGTWLIILLLIVLILFLLSTVLLGSQLHRISTRDKYTVDLGMDAPNGKVELFRVEYANDSGEITVRGSNGQNVVAPGTAVDYDLRLRNHDDCIIDFVMTPSVEFFTEDAIPVQFKLMDTYGNYILGSEEEWAGAAQLGMLQHKGSVHPGEVFTYHISWQWAFETGAEQNAYDTQLGAYSGENPPGLTVNIETQASANPTPVKSNAHMMHLLGEGFGCCWCCWIVWFLLLVCVLLLVWIWRLRRKLSRHEEKMEEYEKLLLANGIAAGAAIAEQTHAE